MADIDSVITCLCYHCTRSTIPPLISPVLATTGTATDSATDSVIDNKFSAVTGRRAASVTKVNIVVRAGRGVECQMLVDVEGQMEMRCESEK